MSTLKTRPNEASVLDFIHAVGNETRKKDAFTLLEIFKEITNEQPIMWGTSIIGFGKYTYSYKSGRTEEWLITGFSPRKQSSTIYIMSGFNSNQDLLQKLGKHKVSKGCLYINKLVDVDLEILKKIIKRSIDFLKEKYPA